MPSVLWLGREALGLTALPRLRRMGRCMLSLKRKPRNVSAEGVWESYSGRIKPAAKHYQHLYAWEADGCYTGTRSPSQD